MSEEDTEARPWKADLSSCLISDANGSYVADAFDDPEVAKLIVLAVNAHETLMRKVEVARRGFELIIEREKTAFSAAALEMARQASMSLQKMEE